MFDNLLNKKLELQGLAFVVKKHNAVDVEKLME
jgi:hypothetical protein